MRVIEGSDDIRPGIAFYAGGAKKRTEAIG